MLEHIFSVKELNDYAKQVIIGDPILSDLTVSGEITGYKFHNASGHRYFQLKDAQANVSCVMYKMNGMHLKFEPVDGMKVIMRANATIYPRNGSFQLSVVSMRKQGVGDLFQQFEELKQKLSAEGLFDNSRKRPIPFYPKCIGVATSADGAALRDIVKIAKRRDPNVEIIVAPCSVQGANAAAEIVQAIEKLNKDGRAEVILCGRGGGSMEDLWCFNEESVARAIYASKIPVISCVGHETDFTIADFTADKRAATPSMAAEIAIPLRSELMDDIQSLAKRISFALRQGNLVRRAHLEKIAAANVFIKPEDILINEKRQAVDELAEGCCGQIKEKLRQLRTTLERTQAQLKALDPSSVLTRGYACVSTHAHLITSATNLENNTNISIRFHDGTVFARTVNNRRKEINAEENNI